MLPFYPGLASDQAGAMGCLVSHMARRRFLARLYQDTPLSPFEERPSVLTGASEGVVTCHWQKTSTSQTGEPLIFSPDGETSASCNLTQGKVRLELLKLNGENLSNGTQKMERMSLLKI